MVTRKAPAASPWFRLVQEGSHEEEKRLTGPGLAAGLLAAAARSGWHGAACPWGFSAGGSGTVTLTYAMWDAGTGRLPEVDRRFEKPIPAFTSTSTPSPTTTTSGSSPPNSAPAGLPTSTGSTRR